jgi:predicted Zn-dependent protease
MPLSADELLADPTFLYLGRRILVGKCALFLGAGASLSSGAPTTTELAKLICNDVLMTDKEFPFVDAVAYADEMAGRKEVARVIVERLEDLSPSPALRGLTAFPWKSIFTTNFDDLIEKAYDQTPDTRAAQLDVYDPARDFERRTQGRIPLYMIHGSCKRPLDPKMGLVITPDDVRRASRQSQSLYRRLVDEVQDSEVVYIGFSLNDPDFQQVIADVREAADNQLALIPRGYALLPGFEPYVQRYWDARKISLVDTTLESFVDALSRLASGKEREQPIQIGGTPNLPRFLSKVQPDSMLADELCWAFEFPELDAGEPQPVEFLRGGPASWATIRDRYDAVRDAQDRILSAVLVDLSAEPTGRSPKATPFTLVDGPAGTGKTTLLMRLAWEIAHTWGHPVAWVRSPAYIQFDLIEELAHHAGQRVYVFIDNCADAGLQVVNIIRRCRTRGIKVSFVVTDRVNEWDASTQANPLEPEHRFSLGRITEHEAEVLDRLDRAGALGTLEGLPRTEQLSRLMDRAGRQLLVALREATEGKRFDEIVKDEYDNIPSDTARNAYLHVCTLYQFGILTRAGILSRVTGTPLADFGQQVLWPTRNVILEEQANPSEQPRYRARHEVIANIVFRRALPTSRARADHILGLLRQLDCGYADDERAFSRLIRYSWLYDHGIAPIDVAEIYAAARRLRPDNPWVVQQEGLSQRRIDRKQAELLLREAADMAPQNDAIKHSQATLLLDEARDVTDEERKRLRARAEAQFERLISVDPSNSAPYVSLSGLYLEEAEEADGPDERVALLVRAEKMLGAAFRKCPATPYMYEMLARVEETAGELKDAEEAYRRAATQFGGDPDHWASLARFLRRQGRAADAASVLDEALDIHPADPLLNYELAQTLERMQPRRDAAIRQAYEYAIAEPVRGHLPQLDYAIYLYLSGDVTAATEQFRQLRALPLPYSVKARPRKWLQENGRRQVFDAEVAFVGATASYVRVPSMAEQVFIATEDLLKGVRTRGAHLPVHIYFNLFGLRATPAAS